MYLVLSTLTAFSRCSGVLHRFAAIQVRFICCDNYLGDADHVYVMISKGTLSESGIERGLLLVHRFVPSSRDFGRQYRN